MAQDFLLNSAEGHHRAHAHAARLRGRACFASTSSPVARAPGRPRGRRDLRAGSCSTGSSRSCSDSSTRVAVPVPGGAALGRLQRDPHAAPVPDPAPRGRGLAVAPGGTVVMPDDRGPRTGHAAEDAACPRGRACSPRSPRGCGSSRCSRPSSTRSAADDNAVRLDRDARAARRDPRRQRRVLVDNRVSVVITVNRQELGDETERVVYRLSQLLGHPGGRARRTARRPGLLRVQPDPGRDRRARARRLLHEGARRRVPGRRLRRGPGAVVPARLGSARTCSGTSARSPRTSSRPRRSPATSPATASASSGVEGVYEHDLAGTDGTREVPGELARREPRPDRRAAAPVRATTSASRSTPTRRASPRTRWSRAWSPAARGLRYGLRTDLKANAGRRRS